MEIVTPAERPDLEDAVWHLSDGFEWCCRSAADASARLELLDDKG